MANKIILKKSSTASKVPLATDLEVGEIAVNLADQKLYTKNASGTVVLVGSGTGGIGDVVGPASATDNALARFDTTTGKLIQNGVVTQDDNGSLANVNAVTFDTTPTSAPTTQGTMYWDTGNGTPSIILDADVALQLGQEMLALVYNGTGSTITNGSVVAVSGAQGQRPSVVLADADSEALSAPTLGIATEDIANGAEGFVTTFGFVRGLNTSAFTAGVPIYLSQTAGAFTATRPSAPAHTVALGWVIKSNASSGEVFVNINNGWELDELHNVLITSPISGNTLIYDATAGVWKNANLTAGTGISVTNGAGSISIANTGVTSAVAGTGISVSGATGAVTITNSDRGSSQNIFKNIAVSGQSTVVADTNDDTLTLVNGTGISITTNATTDAITIANTGVTSVTGTSPVASSGGTTPAISLASGYGDTQNPYASKTANFFLAAPNGTAGVPTFRAIVAADIPTLNQNTTGTASNVTGTVAIANGGTGATTAANARINLGATTIGGNLFTLTNPSAITFPRFNADNTVSALARQDAMDALAGAVTSGQYLRGNGTDVVMSAIQAADVPTLNQNTTGSAATLTTGRTIGMTGDVTWTSASFNGSANVTGTSTLANSGVTAGTYTNPIVTYDAKGRATSASSGQTGYINRVMNGAMLVSQRYGTTAAFYNNTYIIDRWFMLNNIANTFTCQQSTTAPVGFYNSLQATVTNTSSPGTNNYAVLGTRIEGYDISDFNWGTANAATITLSFRVRCSVTGTFGGVVRSPGSYFYPFSYVINSANTWEIKSLTITGATAGTWNSTNGLGLELLFSLGMGSSISQPAGSWTTTDCASATGATSIMGTAGATFYVTGVQIEKASTASTYEYVDFSSELKRCERYYENSFPYGTSPAHGVGDAFFMPHSGSAGCGGNTYTTVLFRTRKRTSPSWRTFDPGAAGDNAVNKARFFTGCNAGYETTSVALGAGQTGISGYFQGGTDSTVMFNWVADAEL